MALQRRRAAATVDVGGVKVGGGYPVVVQSMTNTDTADVTGTVNQVMALKQAGSELVRVTVNTEQAAAAVPKIVDTLEQFGVRVPIIGDFHYNGHLLLKKYPACARALAKYRINPGNVNIGRKTDDNFRTMIEVAVENNKPVQVNVVTLLVNPDEAERLTLASTEGKIQLALRNPMDQTAPHTSGVRPAGLMGSGVSAPVRRVAANTAAPRTEVVKPAPLPTVEIIRGDKRAQEAVAQE